MEGGGWEACVNRDIDTLILLTLVCKDKFRNPVQQLIARKERTGSGGASWKWAVSWSFLSAITDTWDKQGHGARTCGPTRHLV